MKQDSANKQVHSAINDGWMHGGSFLSSILAGTFIGYFADKWLGTEPWLVVSGVILGSYAGFMRMWQYMRSMDEQPDGD